MTDSSWQEVFLDDVAEDVTVGHVGPMVDQYVNNGVPFLRSLNVEPHRVNFRDLKYVTPAFHARLRKSALRPGDVVIVRTGKPGSCAVVPESLPDANCSDLVIVRCGPRLRPRYLSYFINSVAARDIDAHLVGAVQQHFNVGSARRLRLLLPSHAEQDDIVSILGSLDDKIALNRRMNETLEATVRAIFKDWFVDFGPTCAKMEGGERYLSPDIWSLFPDSLNDSGNPAGWRLGTLGDIAVSPRIGVDPSEVTAETPYIGLEHMPRRSIALSDWGNPGKLTSVKGQFQRGDFLFGKLRPYFHKVGVAAVDGICSTDIVVVRARGRLWRAFTIACISTDDFVNFTDRTSTGTKMPRTSWAAMARYGTALPPAEIAETFDTVCWPMIERIEANIHESRALAKARDLLLPKLMSGEIRIADGGKAAG